MSESKFKHYAIKTNENFLAKDSRTNCLEIYEDQASADRVVRRSSQEISVVPCYVYTKKEHVVFDEMYAMLETVLSEMHCLIDEVNDQRASRIHPQMQTPPDLHDGQTLHEIHLLLAKARGEA